ncbi:MAG: hypothetical protein KF771_10250 [Burkholderiales bacterium]|nr:hypothetical protein [Burkholderiales bacterium]
MSNLQRVRRGVFVTLLFAVTSAPAYAAEPLTLFLLKMLRDQIATAAIESAVNAASRPAAPPVIAPALAGVHGVDEAQLRGLIDTGFVHLTPAQRAEVYASLTNMLADPKNALARPLIIEQLAQQASAVRGAHEQLALLSDAQKRAIVADARAEYERLRPEERDQMLQLLQSRVAPIPRELNDLMLTAFMAPLPQ